MREAKGRLGPGNLEGEARKYAGPYPRAAKGECAGETGESGAKTRNTAQASAQGGAKTRSDHAELRGGNAASRQAQQGDHCELWIVYSPVHQLVKKVFFDKLRVA